MKKKVSINEKKNKIFYIDNLLYHQEILDIILDYFTNPLKKRIKYRKIFDPKFKEIFDTIEWIELNFKDKEFDQLDVFFTIYYDIQPCHNLNDIKNKFIHYDYNIFKQQDFHNFEI